MGESARVSSQGGARLQHAYANREALAHYNRALAVCERLGKQVDPSVPLTTHAGKRAVLFVLGEFLSSSKLTNACWRRLAA